MISGIHGMVAVLKVLCITRHFQGHQDNAADANLDRWDYLNIKYDYRAKCYLLYIINE